MNIQPMRVLLVEANQENTAPICRAFTMQAKGVALSVSGSLREACMDIARTLPEVVIAAWRLPDGRGTALVPGDEDNAAYPVLVLISPEHAGVVKDVLQAGAWDYVITSAATLADLPHTTDRALRAWRHAMQCRQLERTLRRCEEQLQQAQKLGTIATLARILVHDFNNRLSSILGYSQIALEELSPSSSAHASLQEVQRASRQAKEQVQQFLTFSRSSEQPAVPIQIKPLVTEVLTVLQASWPVPVDMQLDVPEETGFVLANRVHLHQALLHLYAQVGQATRQMGGRMEIRIDTVAADATLLRQHPELRPGSYLRMQVRSTSDTSLSKPDETHSAPLAAPRQMPTRAHLEIAIVQAIVASHDGFLAVPSSAHRAFVIYLPQVAAMPQSDTCR
jgi:signal transduction histidine kinase